MKSIIGAAVGAILVLGAFPFLLLTWGDNLRYRLERLQAGFHEAMLFEAVPGLMLALGVLLVFVWGRPSRWAGVVGLVVGAVTLCAVWFLSGGLHQWMTTVSTLVQLGAGLALAYLAALIFGGGRARGRREM